MVDINEAFPSKYLKAADLKGTNQRCVMSHIEMEKVGDDMKMVLYFQGKNKGVVLNKTNATAIAEEYGNDTDDWAGHEVILFEAMVSYQDKTVPSIRIRRPAAKDQIASKRPAPRVDYSPPQEQGANALMDDDVPFAPEMRG